MREKELRKHLKCDSCGLKIMEKHGLPLFYVVTVERYGIDVTKVARQDGLAQHIGDSRIAEIMGPDQDLATPMMEPVKLTICEGDCAYIGNNRLISLALEKGDKDGS